MLNNYSSSYTPNKAEVFRALELTSFADVKVVILGQDPYPGLDVAMGLSFSVNAGNKLPKSLVNIFTELKDDLGIVRTNGDLSDWSRQGILLLNTILTNVTGQTNAHKKIGWQHTTDQIIINLSNRGKVIFVLLGRQAQSYEDLIDKQKNIILKFPHPSPLSAYRGFFGSKLFSKINQELVQLEMDEINWE